MTEKILDIQNVTVSFDGFKVLDGLNFSIDDGELRFLIGPNGAGKTTLLDIITGKTKSYKGKVVFDRRFNVARVSEHSLVRKGMSRKFQTPSIFPTLSVYENIEVAASFASAYNRLLFKSTGEQRDRVDAVLTKIGMSKRTKLPAAILSHGEKQWLEIGMLLVQEPKLLLLDEPVAGMSRAEREHTGELLNEIRKDCSILVIEHDMVFVRKFASTVTVLHQGQVLCEGPMETIQNDERVKEVYLGHNQKKAS